MQRRRFLQGSVAVFAMTAVGCSKKEDSDSEVPEETCGAGGDADTHGHFLCIPQADLDNPGNITYTSEGGSHPHEVPIAVEDLQKLAEGKSVTVVSDDSHRHIWELAPA